MLAPFCNNNESKSSLIFGITTNAHEGGLITGETSLITSNPSLISTSLANGGEDVCSFYSGPSDSTIVAFGESCGNIAFSDAGESSGNVASLGGGSTIAFSGGGGFSGGCSSSGGGCSYSC